MKSSMKVQPQYLVQTVTKKELPAPPSGDSWHNPEGIAVERIPDGMRLMTAKEVVASRKNTDVYSYDDDEVLHGGYNETSPFVTYFTDAQYPLWERPQFLGDKLAANKFYGTVNCIGLKGLIIDSSFRSGEYKVCCLYDHFTHGNSFEESSSLKMLRRNFRVYEFDSLLELAKWEEGKDSRPISVD